MSAPLRPTGDAGAEAPANGAISSAPAAPRRLGYVRGFEGLRGVAVIIVVVAHLNIIVAIPGFLVVPGGVVSLDSFFVLSGFLITTLLLKEQASKGRIDGPGFYRRRALRLFPALLAMLIAHAIYAAVANLPADLERDSILSAAFYFTNWRLAITNGDGYFGIGGELAEGMAHLWSLSFEEQFYLVWPLMTAFVLTYARRLRTVVVVIVALMALVALHRANTYDGASNWYPTFIRTDTRFDAFLPGVLLAHLWIRGREPRRYLPAAAWIAAVFLLVCLPIVEISEPFLYYGGLTLIDLACAVLILAIIDGRWRGLGLFHFEPLVRLGTVSYGLYLWHLPVYFAIARYGSDWPSAVSVTAALAISLGFTLLSWFGLERPALRWKRRIEGRPSTQLAPDEANPRVSPVLDKI